MCGCGLFLTQHLMRGCGPPSTHQKRSSESIVTVKTFFLVFTQNFSENWTSELVKTFFLVFTHNFSRNKTFFVAFQLSQYFSLQCGPFKKKVGHPWYRGAKPKQKNAFFSPIKFAADPQVRQRNFFPPMSLLS